MVVSNAHKNFGFLHISFYKVVQIVLPIIIRLTSNNGIIKKRKCGDVRLSKDRHLAWPDNK